MSAIDYTPVEHSGEALQLALPLGRGHTIRQCEHCGLRFRVKNTNVRGGAGRFCSRPCRAISQGARKTRRADATALFKSCEVCGAAIRVKPSHWHTSGTYCSQACMALRFQESMLGAANPNYRHGIAHTNEYARAHHHHRRALTRASQWHHTARDILRMLRRQEWRCIYCAADLRLGYDIDHIIPISRGGHDGVGNVQATCATCNRQKGAKLPIEFIERFYRDIAMREWLNRTD